MVINDPQTLREVEDAHRRYEKALVDNDVATLDDLFWDDQRTIRFGHGENLYGYEAIRAFRAGQKAGPPRRDVVKTVITTFGKDFAVAALQQTPAPGKSGRQMQTWVRMAQGWRIVAAHVSTIADPVSA